MDAWGLVLHDGLWYFWSWGKGYGKVSIRQSYTMDNHTVQRFYKKGHWKDKQIREGIRLFSSCFSGPGKIKDRVHWHWYWEVSGSVRTCFIKGRFFSGHRHYMLPSDLNWSMGKTKGYNNKILVSKTDMKIGSNKEIKKDKKKLPVIPPG